MKLLRLALALMVLLGLVACGGGGTTLSERTASYTVELTLDSTDVGDRTATVRVTSTSGGAVSVDSVTIVPTMLSMGMASPEMPARPLGDGRYEAKPVLISMVGDWEIDVRVEAGGAQETARFFINAPTQ